VLLEMDRHLEGLIPRLSRDELILGIKAFNELCLRSGITSIQDGTPLNSLGRWTLFPGLKDNNLRDPCLNFMVSADHVDNFLDEGPEFFVGDTDLRVGAARLTVTMATGQMWLTMGMTRCLLDKAYNKIAIPCSG
jgi:hypothetical protein